MTNTLHYRVLYVKNYFLAILTLCYSCSLVPGTLTAESTELRPNPSLILER